MISYLTIKTKKEELFLHWLKTWQLEKKTSSFLPFLFTFVSDITVETGLLDDNIDRFLFAIMFVCFIH